LITGLRLPRVTDYIEWTSNGRMSFLTRVVR
jgi:hypothetical protein